MGKSYIGYLFASLVMSMVTFCFLFLHSQAVLTVLPQIKDLSFIDALLSIFFFVPWVFSKLSKIVIFFIMFITITIISTIVYFEEE